MPDNEDSDLVIGLQNNDARYQTILVDKYAGLLHYIATKQGLSHADGMEVVNDTFDKAIKKIDRFDLSRNSKFSSWLAKIALRTALDRYDKIQNQPTVQSIDERADRRIQDTKTIWQEPCPAGSAIGQQTQSLMKQALESLSETDQDILRWRAYEFEHKLIGSWLNKSEGAVKTAYNRAKKRLRRKYLDLIDSIEDKKTVRAIKTFLDIEAVNEETAN